MGEHRIPIAGHLILGWLLLSTGRADAQAARWSAAQDPAFHTADTLSALLNRPGRIVVSPSGELYIPETSLGTIFHLGPDGRFLGRLGRKGSGPGEFQLLASLGWVHDSLWATDPSLHRITLFEPSTGRSSTIPWTTLSGAATGPATGCRTEGWPSPVTLVRDGAVLVWYSGAIYQPKVGRACVDLFLANRRGEVQSRLDSLSRDHVAIGFIDANSAFGLPQPLVDNPWPVPSPDGTRLAIIRPSQEEGSTAFGLDVIQLPSARRLHRDVAVPRVRITTRIRDSVFDSMFALGRIIRADFTAAMLRREFFVPRYLVPVRSFHLMADGTIWFRPETGTRTDPVEWRVLDQQLNDLARLSLPVGVTPIDSRDGLLWTISYDEDDVPRIERYRLKK